MSESKFIKHLKGEDTAKSVLEIQNQRTTTSFANMPSGTSNANAVYSDHRGNAIGVLRGTDNWKLSNINTLIDATTVYGDGRDLTGSYDVMADALWVNATYTFATPKIFNPNTKFVLKLCGERLYNSSDTVPFSLIITIGNIVLTKSFVVAEHAFAFSEEFVIDFSESNTGVIKCAVGTTISVQLLCGAPNASATIYDGMTIFTALQRRVDGDAVASDKKTFPEIEQDIDDINEDIDQIQEDLDDLEQYVDNTFVRLDGNSIMTGPLKMRASISFQCAIAPYWDGVGFFKLNDDNSVTLIASIDTSDGFLPWTTNTYNIGSSLKKWKNLYLEGKLFVSTINNGGDLAVPANTTGTLATKADVDLAANSGRMITDQGVWYAKMYAATVAPAAEDGTNYADFSQVDGQGSPVIVTYNRVNGAWVQDQTITPPAEYDGYVPITSKIWDIPEQAGQQGGRILWNHQSKEFTPYPQIVSFKDIEVTGNSTVIMPQASNSNQIVNKDYVDNAIGDGTITITQSGIAKGSFTTNQSANTTIDIEVGGTGRNVGDIFFTARTDNELNGAVECDGATYNTTDFTGAQSIGALLTAGNVPHVSLATYATLLSTQGSVGVFGWDGVGTTAFRVPSLEDIFIETGTVAQIGDYLAPKIPNLKATFIANNAGDPRATGIVKVKSTTTGRGWDGSGTMKTEYEVDASVASGIYDDTATTVQPNAVRYRAMVQLAVSATDEALETCTSVLADVAANTAAIAGADYVVESQVPTAQNNYTWYRKYKSGWVEQGGTETTSLTVTLPVTMSDTNYTITLACNNYSNNAGTAIAVYYNKATTGFNLQGRWNGNAQSGIDVCWEVKGMAA